MFRLLLPLLAAASLAAQVNQLQNWSAPSGETLVRKTEGCSELRSLTTYEFSVISATLVPADGARPAFCRVMGQILPEVRFEVALPAEWNKRLLMIGNGGYAGENLEAPNRLATRDAALAKGFAFTQTNTGHDAQSEPGGSFAVNSQKLLDYAFRAVHMTAETAKQIAGAYYGAAPAKSYFMGCSTGGRQALMEAQRFPQDFDGILAGAPVLDFVGTMVNYAAIVQAYDKAPVPMAKFRLAADAIYKLCDAKDAVADGVIEHPPACGFQPSVHLPKCANGDAPDCFTPAQIHLFETLYSDQTVQGKRAYPAWPPGAEAPGANGLPGWNNWLIRENQAPLFVQFGESFFRYLAYPQKDPEFRLAQFNFDRDPQRLDWIRTTLNATDPDLRPFQKRGGKLLLWFGWADPALNPNRAVDYYNEVSAKLGPGTQEFFRLFMLPGVFHCGGGPGCDDAPLLAVLIDWVEKGQAPERIVAAKREGGRTVRTRPLCLYPKVATYKGSGNTDEAASFACEPPR